MRLPTIFTTLAVFAPAILSAPTEPTETIQTVESNETTTPAAAPDVIVKNHCQFPVYATSVGKDGPVGPTREVAGGSVWTEPQYWSGTGTALKFTRTQDGLYTGAPVLILAYSYAAGVSIYYDLALHAGNPFEGYKIMLSGAAGNEYWDPAPKPPQTRGYHGVSDLYLDLCL